MAETAQIELIDHTDGEASSNPASPSPPPTAPPQPEQASQQASSHHHVHRHGDHGDAAPPPKQPVSHIDVLYENQRGWFVFGIPLFSARALWNFKVDQAPWVDAHFHPSAVDITNAQVPDPSWEWAWKTWYVDMGRERDVDEEGWEYGLWFRRNGGAGCGSGCFGAQRPGGGWHGNHPWWHSFVRRRRWLRKRVKVSASERKSREFGESFSVGASSIVMARSMGASSNWRDSRVDDVVEEEEITNIATLMDVLKRSAIDREKIVVVGRFVESAEDVQLGYLAGQIPAIMHLLIFQNSRLQLLSSLMSTFDILQEQHEQSLASANRNTSASAQRRLEGLKSAVEAADKECKKLEYWSDIRKLTESGAAGHAVDQKHGWDTEKWEGLDASGPSGPAHHPSKRPRGAK